MKIQQLFKLFSIVLVVAISSTIWMSCENKGNSKMVKITGEVLNPKSDSIFIQKFEGKTYVNYGISAIDELGHFSMAFDLDEPMSMRFFDKNESSQMFILPGDELIIKLDTKEFDESLRYEGSSGNENNFLASYYLQYMDGDQGNAIDFYSESKNRPIDEFYDFVKVSTQERIDYLNEFDKTNELSQAFKDYFNYILHIEDLNALVYVFYGDQALDSIQKVRIAKYKIAHEIIDAKVELDWELDPTLYEFYVTNSIPIVLRKLIYLDHPELMRKNIDSIYYPELSNVLNEYELNKYIYQDVKYRLESFNTKYYESKKDIIDEFLVDKDLAKDLEQSYQELLEQIKIGYAEGLHMQDFGSDENSNKAFEDILANYKGKVIYLDVWASWCGPCKAELPYSIELKKKFEGKDVIFVYLSTDKNLNDWENILALMQMEGEHYRASRSIHKYLSTEYNLQYIPHYIIFDKEGKLVKNNAPRPSSDEITGELEALL